MLLLKNYFRIDFWNYLSNQSHIVHDYMRMKETDRIYFFFGAFFKIVFSFGERKVEF